MLKLYSTIVDYGYVVVVGGKYLIYAERIQ